MACIGRAVRPSIGDCATANFAPKEASMYTQGIDAAIVIGLLAALLPGLWMAWWLVAGIGERVSGRPGRFRTH
jgi:hypothetical protein